MANPRRLAEAKTAAAAAMPAGSASGLMAPLPTWKDTPARSRASFLATARRPAVGKTADERLEMTATHGRYCRHRHRNLTGFHS